MATETVLSVEFKMNIKNGMIFTAEGKFSPGSIVIQNGKVDKIIYGDSKLQESPEDIDAAGMYIIPGLVDIHFHGAAGVDFCEATVEALKKLEEYELQNGITTVFPATMTMDENELLTILEKASEYIEKSDVDVMEGITLEGPFLSEGKKGAQDAGYIRKPDIFSYCKMQKKSKNLIKQVAVAPEEDNDMKFIAEVSKEITVSVAHSMADYDTASRAFSKGAKHVTHLFNGMNPFLHREPGIVGAAFDNPEVYVELICDGVHIHPSVIRAMYKLFGADRICMISDSLSATGMADGEYFLGNQKIIKRKGTATLSDGTLAGSVCNLYDCFVKTVKEMQIPLEQVILSCTRTPAKSLLSEDKCGVIKEGQNADILILDKELNRKYVIKKGRIIKQ